MERLIFFLFPYVLYRLVMPEMFLYLEIVDIQGEKKNKDTYPTLSLLRIWYHFMGFMNRCNLINVNSLYIRIVTLQYKECLSDTWWCNDMGLMQRV